ncbi:protein kinase domain-containing protein [Halobacteriales archaeon Cl-PHB]
MTDADDAQAARDVLVDCLQDPERGKQRLPRVVGMLEDDDPAVRVSAAWTACLVANEHPDVVDYLIRRLSDRLSADEVTLELTSALDYLAARFPETVEDVLDDVATAEAERADRRSIPFPRTGNFTRSHYYGTDTSRAGVGRTRIAGSGDSGGPQRIYAGRDPEYHEREDLQAGAEADQAVESVGEDGAEADDTEEPQVESDYEGSPGALVRRTTDVSAIATQSRFGQLHILSNRERSRYADVYQALVGRGGQEQAVALQLLRLPDDDAQIPAFVDNIAAELRRWGAVDDHDHVSSLLDWGLDPKPWLATSFADETLADQDDFDLERALSDAVALADALSHVHRHDVVHAGIDPKNVAYPGEILQGSDQDPPLLANVGLMHVYRYHQEPALCLDPRFAAPEYYDRQFGTVDPATDIYQLGAVVYRLVTGRPPFTGTFSEVRQQVIDRGPRAPSELVNAPNRLDDVVAKAMATEKLARYETVEHLQQELVAIEEDYA